MFWTIKDIQKFLLSKQIFWDGRVYGRNGFEETSEKSFQPYGEVDCKILKCPHCRQFNYLYEVKGEIKLKYVK